MNTQNQIKRTLSQSTHLEYVSKLLANNEFRNRKALATRVCEAFAFYDPGGQEQRSGCLKALRELEAAGHFTLPASARRCGPRWPRRLAEPVALPLEVPAQAGAVCGLELIMVKTAEQMRIWNELMIEGHPQGAGPGRYGSGARILFSVGWRFGSRLCERAVLELVRVGARRAAVDDRVGPPTSERMGHPASLAFHCP